MLLYVCCKFLLWLQTGQKTHSRSSNKAKWVRVILFIRLSSRVSAVGWSLCRLYTVYFQFVLFARCPPWPERSSQHLPLESKHHVDHFKAAGDFFQDAMVLPELVQLPVALRAKMQWVASPAPNKTGRKSRTVPTKKEHLRERRRKI